MPFDFVVSDVIPAPPRTVYDTWLDSGGHAAMTGGKPARMSAKIGDSVMAHDGFISGRNLALVPGRRIVQSWRSTHFTKDDADSVITVSLDAQAGGTRVAIAHANVPDGHTSYRDGGWQKSYFEPMKRHFARAE